MLTNRSSTDESKLHREHSLQKSLGDIVFPLSVSVVLKSKLEGSWKGCEIIRHIYHKVLNI